jgi:hypothetical protein
MKWARSASSLTLVAALMCAACGSFGADSPAADAGVSRGADAGDAAAACPVETCAPTAAFCLFDDFASGTCRKELTFSTGDIGKPGVVGDCKDGRLHVAAAGTLDMIAELTYEAPDIYDSVRLSASLAVVDWDLAQVLRLSLDGALVAELDFAKTASGDSFTLCGAAGADCAAQAFVAPAGEAHRFTFDITRTTVALSVDCKPIASRTVTSTLAPRATFSMAFGKVDADPIDGTIDDLSVSFR